MPSIEQQVRERAYYIWEGEGRAFGQAVEHWLRAEAEFRALDEVAAPVIAVVQASSAKSPAKTLKPRSARGASAAAVAVKAEARAVKAPAAAKPAAAKLAAKPKTKSTRGDHSGSSAVLH
ncbi:MAG: DUF2934 domain-containing protein [Methylobacterium sp.]|uniref:DUF2934 domain-containing protein n=1 Tax=Methylobacterium sp. TaxID=409 RepID=UPI0025DF4142|nr:DUF2934 domain-containing protein [Methylobacterium sp.]MBX9932660.1 DUF2934 domain-containing protein [Methylobacterium sp.]